MLCEHVMREWSSLLNVAWWATMYRGACGFREVQSLRLVVKQATLLVVAEKNGIHRNDLDKGKAKAQFGHLCFDIAIQAAALQLQASWAICGGYALSILKRRQTPFANYRYVDELPHNASDVRLCEFGDVDLFLVNPDGVAWSEALTEDAIVFAFKVLRNCFFFVAGYEGLRDEEDPSTSDGSSEASDYPIGPEASEGWDNPIGPMNKWETETEAAWQYTNKRAAQHLGVSGLRHFYLGAELLGRKQTIQLVLSCSPKTSPLKVVLSFDMTQCAVWIQGLKMHKGEPKLQLRSPCKGWTILALKNEGVRMLGAGTWSNVTRSRVLMPRRVDKYTQRGYAIYEKDPASPPARHEMHRMSRSLMRW